MREREFLCRAPDDVHYGADMSRSAASCTLNIQVAEDYETLSRLAAALILGLLQRQPNLLLCASAGGTPTRSYELLGARCARNPKQFSRLRVLQIDEWAGLPRSHPATCAADLRQKLVEPLRLSPERFIAFRSEAADLGRECRRVGSWLADHGPIDLCVLGLGGNGHVAMNEPGEAMVPGAHVARLAPSSRNHAMLAGLVRKPRFGLTLGLGDILRSRRILLLVSGRGKRQVSKRLLQPFVTTRFPASFLWLHPDVTVLCDQAAAGTFP